MDIPTHARFRGLLDAVSRHRADPWTFSIPRSDVRGSLARGDRVKLLFSFDGGTSPGVERMWVEVVDVTAEGYIGRLDNEPRAIADLAPASLVTFEAHHVAALWRERPDAPRPEHLAIVSDRIWMDRALPARAVRVPGPGAGFSGWVLLGEADGPSPPLDLAGFRPVRHAEITERFRAFDSIEDEAPGTAWRWDPDTLEWAADRPEGVADRPEGGADRPEGGADRPERVAPPPSRPQAG
jgi:hypothetical protein